MTLRLLSLLALAACTGSTPDPQDTADTGDTGTTEPARQQYAVLTTVSADFTTGSFATVSVDDWTVSDELFVTTGDAAVSVDDDRVFQINRLSYDTARMYLPGDWTAPVWEKELPDLSNPGDADVCAGSLFIAMYGTNTLGVYDPATGNQTGSVDLSEFDDVDGVGPEPGSMVEINGKLYVGLNRLDREDGWSDVGGAVAEVDCTSQTVTNSWSVGGNTSVFPWPGTDQVLVLARAFGDDEGGIYGLDPATGIDHIASVAGENFSGLAATAGNAIAISLAADYSHYATHCIDLGTGAVTGTAETAVYYNSIAGNDRGEAWITAGPSWIDDTAATGIFVFDIDACTERTTDPISLSLAGKDIAFY